ncbi:hypothetical protein C0966_01195 [Bacillus methanolicus]|uniref:hypothetical protein n=1 Tax=Bacillus methanolicus TaxID=1471 RepID=UPI0023806043|nr:hypothetical protein [Bacillus methanolicus]MDE3838020.1 hypothetical protein [Bacillus methanolicus]
MKNQLQMIVYYEVKDSYFSQYKEAMDHIVALLPSFGAAEIKWRQIDSEPYRIVESFLLPTESHYFALKKLRKSKYHTVFGCLDRFISGGLKQVECCALIKEL